MSSPRSPNEKEKGPEAAAAAAAATADDADVDNNATAPEEEAEEHDDEEHHDPTANDGVHDTTNDPDDVLVALADDDDEGADEQEEAEEPPAARDDDQDKDEPGIAGEEEDEEEAAAIMEPAAVVEEDDEEELTNNDEKEDKLEEEEAVMLDDEDAVLDDDAATTHEPSGRRRRSRRDRDDGNGGEDDDENDESDNNKNSGRRQRTRRSRAGSRSRNPPVIDDDDDEEEEEEDGAEADEGAKDGLDDKDDDKDDDDDDDDDEHEQEPEPRSKGGKGKKRRSGGDDDDEANRKERPSAKKHAPAKKPKPSSSSSSSRGGAAEAGIITEIYLENFMCHPKLRIKLGHNANAITGDNGSGKSAVLAAIQICLGANARRTHRARNLKELVRREGAGGAAGGGGSAKIQVTVLNGGPDAYRPEVYGDAITVQRCISLGAGSNGFSLLDHNKKQQSTSKKDLYEMLDHLNIQVENPVSILDQEESKKFLCGKPEDKYKFFMKATDLERMDVNYAATVDQVLELEAAEVRARESLAPLEVAAEEARRRYRQHDALEKLEAKVAQLKCDLLWATYAETRAEHDESMSRLSDFKDKIAKREQELLELEAEMNNPDQNQEALQTRIQELLAECREQTALKTRLDEEHKQASAPYRQLQNQIQNLTKEVAGAKKETQAAQRRLKEYRDKMMAHEGSAASERTRMADKLRAMEEERVACKDREDELKQAVSEALRAYEEAEPKVREAKHAVTNGERQLGKAQARLRSLKDQGDEFAVFGPKVKQVLRLVEEAQRGRKFRGPVIGPIGKYVKISSGHEKYAALAEHAMGPGILDRFIVTCDADLKVLNGIRDRVKCGRDCGVFQQAPSSRYDVRAPSVRGTETIASVITVADDLVYNCLVDNAKIDQRALFSSKKDSEDLLLEQNGQNNCRIRDPNVKQVFFLPRGDKWEILGSGNLFLSSSDKRDLQATSIGVDKRGAIANAEREVQHLIEELNKCKTEDGKYEAEHTQRQRTWNRAKRAMQQNDDRINDLASKIHDLNSEIQESVSVRFDPSEYEEDVAHAEAKVDKLKESLERLTSELKNREPEIHELKGQIDEVVARNKKIGADIEAVQKEQQKVLDTQTQTQTQLEKRKSKLDKLREKAESIEAEVHSSSAVVGQKLREARMATYMNRQHDRSMDRESTETALAVDPTDDDLNAIEPIKVTTSSSKCGEKLKAQQAKIEKERRSRKILNETREEAYEKYNNAKKALLTKVAEVDSLEKDIKIMKKDLQDRNERHQDMRNKLKLLTAYKFDELMRMNNYSGELLFEDGDDDKPGTLDLVVRKSSGGKQTDVKGLSGGERSFSTMCLLLALGEKLETPFRIFDEFDVFLDAQTRKLVMNQMIHMAKKLENRQFIFITPQDLSSLKQDAKCRIYKLNPPARHSNGRVDGLTQTMLNFAPQGED